MRLLLVDDERRARNRLRQLVAGLPGVEIMGEAGDGITALEIIARGKPDVVLLDVQMPGLNGIEMVGELRGPHVPLIIFVTAYDRYALQAFEVSAVDYLLKPVSTDRLQTALSKAGDHLQARALPAFALEQMTRLMTTLESSRRLSVERVVGRRGAKLQVIPVESVQAFVADNELVFALTENDRVPVNHTLRELEGRLDPGHFVRVHKQTIVNLLQIVEVEPMFKGGAVARLRSGRRIDISRRYAAGLREKLGG
ncbi:MAG: response regulator [Acidobacteriia bacterium]|nr:response regulator [Terriglobia bacterium]